MNYPYRKAILDFLRQRDDGSGFQEAVVTLAENYPPHVLACCMNLLGTHDTPRILTLLGAGGEGRTKKEAEQQAAKSALEKMGAPLTGFPK